MYLNMNINKRILPVNIIISTNNRNQYCISVEFIIKNMIFFFYYFLVKKGVLRQFKDANKDIKVYQISKYEFNIKVDQILIGYRISFLYLSGIFLINIHSIAVIYAAKFQLNIKKILEGTLKSNIPYLYETKSDYTKTTSRKSLSLSAWETLSVKLRGHQISSPESTKTDTLSAHCGQFGDHKPSHFPKRSGSSTPTAQKSGG